MTLIEQLDALIADAEDHHHDWMSVESDVVIALAMVAKAAAVESEYLLRSTMRVPADGTREALRALADELGANYD